MNDEREAFAAAIAATTAPQALRVLHKAIVVDQEGGDVGVKMPDDDAPSATAKPVPIWFGLPGFSAEFKPEATPQTAIGFHGGAENKAFSALYPYHSGTQTELPIHTLSFGAGTKPIARVDDEVDGGKILFRFVPVGPSGVPSTLTISYRPPGGIETPIISFPIPGPAIILTPDLEEISINVGSIKIRGKITTGRTEFLA
jgi:hypothetical protein